MCKSSASIVYRTISEFDLNSVQILYKECFPVSYPSWWYKDLVSNPHIFSLAAVYSDVVIGIIVFKFITLHECNDKDQAILDESFPLDSQVAYICSLGVKQTFRSNGVASQLLSALLHYVCKSTHLLLRENVRENFLHLREPSTFDPTAQFPRDFTQGAVGAPHLHPSLARLVSRLPHQRSPCRAIYLHVLRSNQQARSFYKRRGFRLAHVKPGCYSINDSLSDGCTYVFYCNNGFPPMSPLDPGRLSLPQTSGGSDTSNGGHRAPSSVPAFRLWMPEPVAWLFHLASRVGRVMVEVFASPPLLGGRRDARQHDSSSVSMLCDCQRRGSSVNSHLS